MAMKIYTVKTAFLGIGGSKSDDFDFTESDLGEGIDDYYDLDIENLGPDQPGNVFVDKAEEDK